MNNDTLISLNRSQGRDKTVHQLINLEDYNPKIDELSETLMLGPQANLVDEIQRFNSRWRTNVGTNKVFNWKPGFYDEIKRVYCDIALGWSKKNAGTYHFFRRIEDGQWQARNFKNSLKRIEEIKSSLKSQGLRWQDNSDKAKEVIKFVIDKIKSQLKAFDQINTLFKPTASIIYNQTEDSITNSYRPENESNSLGHILITFMNTEPINMEILDADEVYLGTIVYPHQLKISFTLDILRLSNSLSLQEDFYDDKALYLNYSQSTLGINNQAIVSAAGSDGEKNAKSGLKFPYIARRYDFSQQNTGVCFGDMSPKIGTAIKNLELVAAANFIRRWATLYVINKTNPLNNLNQMYHGKPEHISGDIYQQIGHKATDDCHYGKSIRKFNWDNSHIERDKLYCDMMECKLRDQCYSYNLAQDEDSEYIHRQLMYEDALICFVWRLYRDSHYSIPSQVEVNEEFDQQFMDEVAYQGVKSHKLVIAHYLDMLTALDDVAAAREGNMQYQQPEESYKDFSKRIKDADNSEEDKLTEMQQAMLRTLSDNTVVNINI